MICFFGGLIVLNCLVLIGCCFLILFKDFLFNLVSFDCDGSVRKLLELLNWVVKFLFLLFFNEFLNLFILLLLKLIEIFGILIGELFLFLLFFGFKNVWFFFKFDGELVLFLDWLNFFYIKEIELFKLLSLWNCFLFWFSLLLDKLFCFCFYKLVNILLNFFWKFLLNI